MRAAFRARVESDFPRSVKNIEMLRDVGLRNIEYHLPTKERHLGMISELQADSIKFDFVVSFDYQENCFNVCRKRFVENLFKVVSLRLFQSIQEARALCQRF